MSSRYYDSCGSEGEIRPGRISAELREALNIPDNDLPSWIYRMRALGYPPGWLKKAIVDTNDIFDTDSPPKEEAGSKKRKHESEEVQYDHSKLIEYPGFNAPMPPNCNDYHYFMNMPAMLEHQQLEYAKKHMSAFKPVQIPKRIKKTNDNCANSSNNTSSAHLDLEAEGPESPESGESSNATSANETKVTDDEGNKATLSKSTPDIIKLVSKGSPMPKPVERAPLEKFSQGVVGELLYFENIPNSTGKFDSIRGLLNTIRKSKSENDTSFTSTKSL